MRCVLPLLAIAATVQAQGQHDGLDCAQALSSISAQLNAVSINAS